MESIRSKLKIIIVIFLTILELSLIFLAWKSLSVKETKIDDVKFQEEVSNKKKSIAIMLNEGSGEYIESTSNNFPASGYIYNTEKSGCIDTTGKEVVNVLEYENGKVNLKLKQKVYCYLYFDKKDKPLIDKFYINDETSNKTTKVPEVTIHLKWSDPYIKEYCLSETSNIDSCTWTPSNDLTEITTNYTFTGEGNKTLYAYIKDKAEGISEVKSDSITYANTKSGSDLVNNPKPGPDGGAESTGVAEDELAIRYYGINPDNYICFGTNDKSTCINDQDTYMYRIIGITKETSEHKEGMFKVIKKTKLTTMQWWTGNTTNKNWPDSLIKQNLNGSSYLTNNTYGLTATTPFKSSKKWSDLIVNTNWKYGDVLNGALAGTSLLNTEMSWTTTTPTKIGLMYLSDYVMSVKSGGENCYANSASCQTNSWLHISKVGDNIHEWTMSRYGYDGNNYLAWTVYSNGSVAASAMNIICLVRPVFYVDSNVQVSGEGTETNPYLIVS